MKTNLPPVMPSSMSASLRDTFLVSDVNILDETQRLIEEAELKLCSMQTEMNQDTNSTRPNVCSPLEDHHVTSNSLKNYQLRQALDTKMKKLERELEMQWLKQVTASDSVDASLDHIGAYSGSQVEGSCAQQSRVRQPHKRISKADRGPQDVVDVVRTARDSVQGALIAARKLSTTLDNRTPRLSHQSASVVSVRPPTHNQPADPDCARFCVEHDTRRKMCRCLRPLSEGLKLEENKMLVKDGEETAPFVAVNLASTKSNVGIFEAKCATSVSEVIRQPQKRLQMSVMPSVSIKRRLEKQVMPVIQVPFPGSTPDITKRKNTGVRNFKHSDPEECGQSAVVQQLDSVEALRDSDHAHLKEAVEFLLEKMTSSQTDSGAKASRHPPSDQDSKFDRSDEFESEKGCVLSSGSSRHAPKDEPPISADEAGIAYNSLSRFLETYSKAAVESERVKQKTAERKKEEERSMKVQEQRFKTALAENRQNEANLIGPFRRAILNGRLRKSNSNSPVACSSNQEARDVDSAVMPKEDFVHEKDGKADLGGQECFELNETVAKESKATFENFPPLKSSELGEKHLEADCEEKNEDASRSSTCSISNADALTPVHAAPVPSSLKTEASSNDEYEDDWEEENEGVKIMEESVETRDVGDGSERDSHDETRDGVAHTLRTILEVEENSSLSVSLVHHEPVSQESHNQSGANKSGSQPTSKSLTEAGESETLILSRTENKAQPDNSVAEVSRRAVLGKDVPKYPEVPQSAVIETVAPKDQLRSDNNLKEFSSCRAFLEMTEALRKMLETVVSSLLQTKPTEEVVLLDETVRQDCSSSKRFVRFEGGVPRGIHYRRSGARRYVSTSSGSAIDDRVSSGSEGSHSYSRSIRWNTQVNRKTGRRVRFKAGSKQSSATQTEVGEAFEDLRRDVETQVTPEKQNEERAVREWQVPEGLFLRPRQLILSQTVLRPAKPISLPLKTDPTERLLAFGRAFNRGGADGVNLSPERQGHSQGQRSVSQSSSSSSVLRTDESEYSANNTVMSLSEGEVLGYHSCSCSEGEMCLCAGKCRRGRTNYCSELSGRVSDEAVLAGSPPFTQNPWSTLDLAATDNLDHFSEGEIIEKLIGISHLLNKSSEKRNFLGVTKA